MHRNEFKIEYEMKDKNHQTCKLLKEKSGKYLQNIGRDFLDRTEKKHCPHSKTMLSDLIKIENLCSSGVSTKKINGQTTAKILTLHVCDKYL